MISQIIAKIKMKTSMGSISHPIGDHSSLLSFVYFIAESMFFLSCFPDSGKKELTDLEIGLYTVYIDIYSRHSGAIKSTVEQ
jgi:hypothetical protein